MSLPGPKGVDEYGKKGCFGEKMISVAEDSGSFNLSSSCGCCCTEACLERELFGVNAKDMKGFAMNLGQRPDWPLIAALACFVLFVVAGLAHSLTRADSVRSAAYLFIGLCVIFIVVYFILKRRATISLYPFRTKIANIFPTFAAFPVPETDFENLRLQVLRMFTSLNKCGGVSETAKGIDEAGAFQAGYEHCQGYSELTINDRLVCIKEKFLPCKISFLSNTNWTFFLLDNVKYFTVGRMGLTPLQTLEAYFAACNMMAGFFFAFHSAGKMSSGTQTLQIISQVVLGLSILYYMVPAVRANDDFKAFYQLLLTASFVLVYFLAQQAFGSRTVSAPAWLTTLGIPVTAVFWWIKYKVAITFHVAGVGDVTVRIDALTADETRDKLKFYLGQDRALTSSTEFSRFLEGAMAIVDLKIEDGMVYSHYSPACQWCKCIKFRNPLDPNRTETIAPIKQVSMLYTKIENVGLWVWVWGAIAFSLALSVMISYEFHVLGLIIGMVLIGIWGIYFLIKFCLRQLQVVLSVGYKGKDPYSISPASPFHEPFYITVPALTKEAKEVFCEIDRLVTTMKAQWSKELLGTKRSADTGTAPKKDKSVANPLGVTL